MGDDLLERERESAQLRAAVDGAAAGRGTAVLVVGEAGIGKTSLVRSFVRDAGPGVRVLTGSCDDLPAPRPLGPLRDAACGTGGPLAEALARGRAGGEVLAALPEELSGAPPAVLVVEDVHWADDATLDALTHLVGRIDEVGAVLVLTLRDDAAVGGGHPLQRLLGALVRAAALRIPLGPLSPAAVASLAAGTGRDPKALFAITRGNPFYVTEVLADPQGDVPDTVADAVLARVGALGENCRRAVERLCVIPTHVALPLAETVLGGRLDDLVQAEEQGVVEVRGQELAFRHELARQAIERSLPALRRRVFNRGVLRALKAQPQPDLDRLVHHAVLADDVDTVVVWAPRAAREAARAGSHRQALAHFEVALRHRDRFTDGERARLMDEYAWELYNAHRFAHAIEAGEEAVRLHAALDEPVPLGEALVRLSRHLYMAGATDAAERAVDRAVTVLDPTGDLPALALALTHRGALLTLTGHGATAFPVLNRALGMAAPAHRFDLVALCLNHLGTAAADRGDPAGAVALVHRSLDVSRRAGSRESTARAYTSLGELLYRFGEFERLDRVVREGLAFTREHGLWSHAYNLEVHRCLVLLRRGRTEAAEEGLRALLDGVDDPGMLYAFSVPPYARLLARRGDVRAEGLLAEAWRRALRHRSLPGLAYAGVARAEWAWLAGRPDVAAEVSDALLPRLAAPGCASFRAELLDYTARCGLPPGPGGDPAAVDGRSPDAVAPGGGRDWRDAAARWAAAGAPYEEALALAGSGEREPTVRAVRLLEGVGAHATAALVRERLRGLGLRRLPRGPATRTRAHPAGLTARQADVLDLVARGMTNAQIAERLVLSVRTVDHHVAAILGKLAASSRHEAARIAGALGVLRLGTPLAES
ncbi:ATP-binding protein [Streptomyces sp. CRN 30]|uniref:ATP-binding protein n=1 Tax=Streptomyces sp. CRN 30 TaxID=3075613 RepID=UPI002A7FFC04|nr:AAA family ATPase [Streptomyces sp. CRN 30]